LTALGFSSAADGFTSSSTLFVCFRSDFVTSGRHIVSTDRPLNDYANSALIAADVELFWG
jgi:hypothetical protein